MARLAWLCCRMLAKAFGSSQGTLCASLLLRCHAPLRAGSKRLEGLSRASLVETAAHLPHPTPPPGRVTKQGSCSQSKPPLAQSNPAGRVTKLRLLGDSQHKSKIAFLEFESAQDARKALNCSGAVLGAWRSSCSITTKVKPCLVAVYSAGS